MFDWPFHKGYECVSKELSIFPFFYDQGAASLFRFFRGQNGFLYSSETKGVASWGGGGGFNSSPFPSLPSLKSNWPYNIHMHFDPPPSPLCTPSHGDIPATLAPLLPSKIFLAAPLSETNTQGTSILFSLGTLSASFSPPKVYWKKMDVLQIFLHLLHVFVFPSACFFFFLWKRCHHAKELLVNELSEPSLSNSFVYCCLCNRHPLSVPCNAGLIDRSILSLHIRWKRQGGHWWCEKHVHPNRISLIRETFGLHWLHLAHLCIHTPFFYVGCYNKIELSRLNLALACIALLLG